MPPLTQEQLEQRLHGIGSSDLSAIVGENPYRNASAVWLEKRGLAEPFDGNDATWLGSEMEPVIAKRYTLETGAKLEPGPGTVAHRSTPWALATTDYERVDRSRIVEAKWVGMRTMPHWTMDADGAPVYVQIQTQWQMFCRDFALADVAVIFGATAEFRIYEFTRDEAMIGSLVAIAGKFWRDHVIARVPPAVDGSESARAVLSSLYPSNRKPLKPAPVGADEWFYRRIRAAEAGKVAEAEVDLCTNKLIEMIGDADGITGGFGAVTFKMTKAGRRQIRMYPRKEIAA